MEFNIWFESMFLINDVEQPWMVLGVWSFQKEKKNTPECLSSWSKLIWSGSNAQVIFLKNVKPCILRRNDELLKYMPEVEKGLSRQEVKPRSQKRKIWWIWPLFQKKKKNCDKNNLKDYQQTDKTSEPHKQISVFFF